MVGSLLLLKMLHCKRMCARRTNNDNKSARGKPHDHSPRTKVPMKKENRRTDPSDTSAPGKASRGENSSTITIKKEHNETVCRICLKEGSIPIYGEDGDEETSKAVNMFGGVDIRFDDPHPKYLCQLCNSLLQSAILFRKTAQQSDELLKHPETKDSFERYDTMDCSDDDIPLGHQKVKVKKQEEYLCKRCNIKFDTFKELDEHKLSEEHENMRHVCPYCHKTYAPLYYKKHLALHKKLPLFVCDVCGKEFVLQGSFTRHRLTHFYKLPYKCTLCPYKGRFRESLKMHMRSHTGEKPYQCTECPSRFISKSNLNKHMLTHKDEQDFKCDTCGRGFYTKREIELHYKVDHGGAKDHVCKICGKAFGYRKQMMKHELKVHKRAKLRSGRTPIYLKVESMQQQGEKIVTES